MIRKKYIKGPVVGEVGVVENVTVCLEQLP